MLVVEITDAMVAKAAEVIPALTEGAVRKLLEAALADEPAQAKKEDIFASITAWQLNAEGLWEPYQGISDWAHQERIQDAQRRVLLAMGAKFKTRR